MIINSLLISLLFHDFFLLPSWLIGSLFLSIYGHNGIIDWYPNPANITYILLLTWQCLKYICCLSSNIEWTYVAYKKGLYPFQIYVLPNNYNLSYFFIIIHFMWMSYIYY